MTTFLNTTAALPDDLPVRLNAHGEKPFATIDLSEHGYAYLTVSTPAEADALIKAACEAKRLLEQAERPSPWPGSYLAEPWGGALPVDAP